MYIYFNYIIYLGLVNSFHAINRVNVLCIDLT